MREPSEKELAERYEGNSTSKLAIDPARDNQTLSRLISYSVFQNIIGQKLLVSLLSIVLALTLSTVAYRLYEDFHTSLEKLEHRIDHVEQLHENLISGYFWRGEFDQLTAELTSIRNLNDFDFLEVSGGGRKTVSVGVEPDSDHIERTFKLRDREQGRHGTLRVVVSIKEIRSQLKREVVTRMIFWMVVLGLMSVGIMIAANLVVTRHIKAMADFTNRVEHLNLKEPMRLKRSPSRRRDELDQLVDSYNRLQLKLVNYHQDLKRKHEALEELSQQKDQFLDDISNELITPLNSLVSIGESLMSSNVGDLFPNEKEKLFMLVSSSKRLSLLVNDIRDFSKLRHGDVQLDCTPLHLKPLIKLMLFLNRPLLGGKNLLIRTEIPEQIPPLMVDETKIQQVLQNLIKNAIQNTVKGQVIISAELVDELVQIEIKDSGSGLSEEQLRNLKLISDQDRNSTIPQYAEQELGYCIAQKLTELHGGKFRLDSKLGYGTVVRASFPIADQKFVGEVVLSPEIENLRKMAEFSKEVVEEEATAQKIVHPLHKILVVDDDKVAHFILENFLKDENYAVSLASDGMEALEMVEKQKPDLVILDIIMPGMNGFEVCAKLREKYSDSDLPIILLSSNSELQQQINGLSSGANDYLSKPVVKSELIARIQNQIKIMQANRRMSSLLDFSHQVKECKDARDLFQLAFATLERNTYFNVGAVVMNGEVIRRIGAVDTFPGDKYLQELTPQQEIDQFPVIKSGKGSAIYFTVKGFENFRVYLFRNEFNGHFSSNALSYIVNLFREICSIREISQPDLSPKGASDGIISIKQRLEYICFIQASSPFCMVYLENEKKPLELPISMKEIELYLGDDPLCRVHRKYFVNPEKASSIRKKNQKDYELLYGSLVVPIGRTYLKKFRSKYTYLFSR